jgi:hypothetical protein
MAAAVAAVQVAGAQQGQLQAGAPAPVAEGQPPPKFNRYEGELKEMQKNAAFGVFVPDLLKAQTKGEEDMARGIKLMIRKQYYTSAQVTRLLITFTVIGMMISAALYTSLWSKIDTAKYYGSLIFGICAGAFSMMVFWWFVGANWHAVCNADNPLVDEDRHGRDCLEHADCSIGAVGPNMCIQERPTKFWRGVRGTLMLALLGGAVAAASLAGSAEAWDPKTTFAGLTFGSASGAFLWQIFPLDNNRRQASK